ncbi:MAG TPA: ATP-dependent helicase HrpB [Tepidisphaeraceae bacterium]|jgi:ATP-dependent helicase HrpB|nr:ATP-dependent helicase HrpB [Tepidisphaeraceae bacterium]
MSLPIHFIRDQLLSAISRDHRLVLTAPTGSGKTTQVPQFLLLREANLSEPQIIVLQPRRLAARMVAQRVASELGSAVGDVVGYQTRHESKISDQTRIRFMTEGLFLRLIQSQPKLPGVGAVILDEFHERNLARDLSLALVKRLQERGREDLRLIVMSATLDTKLVAEYLAAPTLEGHGRAYPVDVRYLDKRPVKKQVVGKIRTRGSMNVPVWELAAEAARDVLEEQAQGDVLIFMPGAFEIRRTVELLPREDPHGNELALFPLHSQLSPREQDEAVSPSKRRKVIVSTNVAETSITIEGIGHVIDSGLARVNRFDPRRGLNALVIEPISKASADQRSGRAGRTGPGTAMRLWTVGEEKHRPAQGTPEIQRLDLAEALLSLHAMDVGDVREFPWLQPPTTAAVEQAEKTLVMLGAVSADAKSISASGKQMAVLPMHPRLSRMLVEAAERNCLKRACLWAALISEREVFLPNAKHGFADDLPERMRSDFLVLEWAMEWARQVQFDGARCAARGLNAQACREVEKTRQLFESAARSAGLRAGERENEPLEAIAKSLLVAFPDHLAMRLNPKNPAVSLTNNRRGQIDPSTVAQHVGLLLPIEVTEIGAGSAAKTVLSMITELYKDWVEDVLGEQIARERVIEFNPQTKAVEAVERAVFQELVIEESPPRDAEPSAAGPILAEQIISGRLKLERWNEEVDQWMARVRCVAKWFPERALIGYSDDEIRLVIEEFCEGAVRHKDLGDKPMLPFFKNALSWEDQQFVEKMAPEWLQLPRGWRMKIHYDPVAPPRGRAKIQDLYGLEQTPTVAAGRQKVLLEILGPNMRPLQLTEDLSNFWRNLYPELKKQLSRRYPKHEWR